MQKAGCKCSPLRGGYFLFRGKLSDRLTIPRFGCIHISKDTCITIRKLFLSRCPGSLSVHSICADTFITQEVFAAVLFSRIRVKLCTY